MSTVHRLIEPRDPLIFRDGRPFAAGITSRSLPWPYPTVTVGTARTRLGLPAPFSKTTIERLKEMAQRGPLLAYDEGGRWKLALPRPHDAAIFSIRNEQGVDELHLYPCRPHSLEEEKEGTDLQAGDDVRKRLSLVFAELPRDKPPKDVPVWWRWDDYTRWLLHGNSEKIITSRGALGVESPVPQVRVHVAIDPSSNTAAEGQLFTTEALEFAPRVKVVNGRQRMVASRLALYCEFSVPEVFDAERLSGLISIGGERRLARWHESKDLFSELNPPEGLLEHIVRERRLRLILITPGSFATGWVPGWLVKGEPPPVEGSSLRFKLNGAAADRFAPISGWDLENRRPKATRFLSPAGAVFFLTIDGNVNVAELERLWLRPVSDSEAARLDGFGLCLLGAW